MLSELFDRIVKQAVTADANRTIKTKEEPGHVYYLRGDDGKLTKVEAAPAPRDHRVGDLDAFVKAVIDLPTDGDVVQRTVWYSRAGIFGLLNDATRRDRVVMDLAPSPQMQTLAELERGEGWENQSDFIRLLRISLAGCSTSNLLSIVRSVRFSTNQSGQSEAKQGKVSIGRSLEAELTGAEAVPEEITLNVPVFTSGYLGWQKVLCAVEVNPQTATFRLVPLPGQLENATIAAEMGIGKLLNDGLTTDAAQVYYGKP